MHRRTAQLLGVLVKTVPCAASRWPAPLGANRLERATSPPGVDSFAREARRRDPPTIARIASRHFPRGLVAFGLILGLLVCAGCGDDEKDVRKAYARVVFNAKMGNEDAFLDGFTKKSALLVKGLLALRRNYGDLTSAESDPYLSLVLEEVEEVEVVEEKGRDEEQNEIDVKKAIVTVTDGNILRKITMIKTEDGVWKIDALANQKLWHADTKAWRTKR